MGKRIKNIIKYILFLGLGVYLFYTATLGITRGSVSADQFVVPFAVGHGMEACDLGGTVEITVSTSSDDPIQCVVTSTADGKAYAPDFSTERSLARSAVVCLPEGSYSLQISPQAGEVNVSLNGVNRTDELLQDMSRANWWGIALSFLLGYLAIVSRGLRWLMLLEPMGYHPKKWNSIHSVAFAYFANTFVPRSGELARCAVLNQIEDIPVDKLFGTVISERVVDFVMLFTMTGLAILTNLGAFNVLLSNMTGESDSSMSPLFLYGGLVLAGLVLLFFIFRRKILTSPLFLKVVSFLKGVFEGLKSVLKMKRRGAFIFHTVFIWVMYFLMAFVVFKSIDGTSHMGIFDALFVMVAGGFGMVLPAPGGIGSYHWAVKLGFIALGLSGTLGFAVANVIWLTQTLMIILGGGIGYLAVMYVKVKKDQETEAGQ
ncbi:MAG: flippase-like domain-containing protein [Flavobacteriales bacterium]|nr:flippase-like domain-containing protein [Flavobacteriales bacterium]